MKKFICSKVAGLKCPTFLKNEFFHGFFFFFNFSYFSGITISRKLSIGWFRKQRFYAVLSNEEQKKDEKRKLLNQNGQGFEGVSVVQKLPAKKCLYL